MPRFDFLCDVDGEIKEVSIRIADVDTTVVKCQQGHQMRRLFTAAPFHFRGKFSPEYWGYTEKRDDGLTPLAE